MWNYLLRIGALALPYIPKAVLFILRKIRAPKITISEDRIRGASIVLDELLDFNAYAKTKNIWVRGILASVEMVDGKLIEFSLKELISVIPEEKHYLVNKYLDAIISKNWLAVIDSTADVANVFLDIKGADENEEKTALAAIMLLIFKFIKDRTENLVKT